MIPQYDHMLFSDVWNSADDFLTDWKESGLFQSGLIKDNSIKTLFYLLYQRFGNSPIANLDVNQAKLRIHTTIWQFGPTWEKKLDIQTTLRTLEEADLVTGTKNVHNMASNPSGTPSADSVEELEYIDSQSVDSVKRGKLEAYNMLWNLLEDDVTGKFIDRFANCFLKVVAPQRTVLYEEEEEIEDDN